MDKIQLITTAEDYSLQAEEIALKGLCNENAKQLLTILLEFLKLFVNDKWDEVINCIEEYYDKACAGDPMDRERIKECLCKLYEALKDLQKLICKISNPKICKAYKDLLRLIQVLCPEVPEIPDE